MYKLNLKFTKVISQYIAHPYIVTQTTQMCTTKQSGIC